jgi:predicted MPP superfamily phosphohydrolase
VLLTPLKEGEINENIRRLPIHLSLAPFPNQTPFLSLSKHRLIDFRLINPNAMPMNIAIIITLFVLLLALGIWTCLTLLAKNLQWSIKPFHTALIIALVYSVAVFATTFYMPDISRWLKNALGTLTLAFCLSAFYWLVYAILKRFKRQALLIGKAWAWGVILLSIGFSVLGNYNFHKSIAVETFTITSKKITQPYRFVQISDIQYGTSTRQEMNDILETAYAQNPDFIVFTGDLVDFNHYAFSDFAKLAASPVPVFFERGNHEFYHHPVKLLAYLKKLAPLDVLINRRTDFEELQIIGLDFSRAPNNVAKQLANIEIDPDKFSILLYHEPREVEVAASHNIDLLLYGHTHAGQMWPYTWVVDLMYTYSDGAFKLNNSFIYTSDGASLWGPRMRLGSQNEIAVFNLVPEKTTAKRTTDD